MFNMFFCLSKQALCGKITRLFRLLIILAPYSNAPKNCRCWIIFKRGCNIGTENTRVKFHNCKVKFKVLLLLLLGIKEGFHKTLTN